MQTDPTPYTITAAALVVALWSFTQLQELKTNLQSCEAQYQGFKEGVIYGE